MYLQFTIKILCILFLIAIIAQDFRERAVYIWLLLSVGFLMALFYFFKTNTREYLSNVGINLGVILVIIGILFLYAKLKLKTPLHKTFGLGDVLFFIAIAISFPIATFLILFSFSLLFSLVFFQLTKTFFQEKSVPLAGLQALFFLVIFSINWSFQLTNLYAL